MDDVENPVEVTKTTVGNKVCEEEQVVEVFEDRKILAKRITEYVKPIVWKIKTEYLDECGRVTNVVVEELDESTLKFNEGAPVEEPVVSAQSFMEPPVHREPTVTHLVKSHAEMLDLAEKSPARRRRC